MGFWEILVASMCLKGRVLERGSYGWSKQNRASLLKTLIATLTEFQFHLKVQCVIYAPQVEPNRIAKIINKLPFLPVWEIAKTTSEATYVRLLENWSLGKSEKQETKTKFDLNVISFMYRRNNWNINRIPLVILFPMGRFHSEIFEIQTKNNTL